MSTIGMRTVTLYSECEPAATDTVAQILNKIQGRIIGVRSETFDRYRFNSRKQQPNESVDTYVAALRLMIDQCNYTATNLRDSLIRDRIVMGISDETTRARLLQTPDLTLRSCIDTCRTFEAARAQLNSISHSGGETSESTGIPVHAIEARKRDTDKHERQCRYCGNQHEMKKEKCPAWGKTCSNCSKKNHFKVVCRSKPEEPAALHTVAAYEETFTVATSPFAKNKSPPLYAEMLINGKPAKMQLDTGAGPNVVSKTAVGTSQLTATSTILVMYNRQLVYPLGRCTLTLTNPKNPSRSHEEVFEVVEQDWVPLLGRNTVEKMNLITVNYENFKHVHTANDYSTSVAFNESLGEIDGEIHLCVDPDIKPRQEQPRRVPVAIQDEVKTELDRMVQQGIISHVEKPTEWCSQMSVARKRSGALRICLDPRHLNTALIRERYMNPTMEDILPEIGAARVFSKLDLSQGYWQCTLDEQSSYLTTMVTPWGRYTWKRLPFGLKVSGEIFQRKLHESLEGLSGIACVADDILVFGNDQMSHDTHLTELIKRCEERHIRLNKNKCEFSVSRISFLGHIISDAGLEADPEKVLAVAKMPPPTDAEGVRRIMGSIGYLAKFLPRLSSVAEPIRATISISPWAWTAEAKEAYARIKMMVSDTPILQYYQPSKELLIECDASSKGLGAALMQDGQPIGYASRALTSTEQNYAQIEKECLAIVFSVERFHQYTFGRPIIVHTDHKPLEVIVKKPLSRAPKRLQSMMLKLLNYDLEIKYVRGTSLHIPDMLSRAYIPTTGN